MPLLVKSIPTPPKVGESYFSRCERDEHGQCLPEGQGGESSSSEPSAQATSGGKPVARSRVHKIMEEAKAVGFSAKIVGSGDVIERRDYESIKEAMTQEEQEQLEEYLARLREDSDDAAMENFEPQIDEMELASTAGCSKRDIKDKVTELIEEHGGDATDELLEALDDWNPQNRRGYGERGVGDLLEELESKVEDIPEDLISAINSYKDDVAEEMRTAEMDEIERQTDAARDDLDYDDTSDRIDYLREFWDDHNHEARFSGGGDPIDECGEMTWCEDDEGDGILQFNTSAGVYTANAVHRASRRLDGHEVPDLQFKDPSDKFSVTGAGASVALEVFAKVVPAMVAYVQHKDLYAATLSAAEPSRQRLYDRLVKSVCRATGYTAGALMGRDGSKYYVICKQEVRDVVFAAAGKLTGGYGGQEAALEELKSLPEDDKDDDKEPLRYEEMEIEVKPEWWTEEAWQPEDPPKPNGSSNGKSLLVRPSPFIRRFVTPKRVLPTPRQDVACNAAVGVLGKSIPTPPKVTGALCQQGQTQAETGCTPVAGEGVVGQSKKPGIVLPFGPKAAQERKERMLKRAELRIPTEVKIPQLLYVAVPSFAIERVDKVGLTTTEKAMMGHDLNRKDSVYLARDLEGAQYYAGMYEGSQIYAVHTSALDRSRFYYDPLDPANGKGDAHALANPEQFAYRGEIGKDAVVKLEMRNSGTKALGVPHSYGCLLLPLPLALRNQITDWVSEQIAPEHLGAGGMEYRPHITIKYGFSSNTDVDALRNLLAAYGPVPVRLLGLGVFRGGKDGDVLHAQVESPLLHQLNARITANFDCPGSKYPKYVPHVTLAYLRPEAVDYYLDGNQPPFLFETAVLTEAEYSAADGPAVTMPLSFLPMFGSKAIPPAPVAGPCEQGQTQEKTGCTPRSGEGNDSEGVSRLNKEPPPKAVTNIKDMVKIQFKEFKRSLESGKYGDVGKEMLATLDEKKFNRNWNKTLKGLEADPSAVADIQKAIDIAHQEYDIPTSPIFVRKLTAEEKAIGENAHWDNGFMVVSDDVMGENRYRSKISSLDDSNKATVKVSYPNMIAGLIVHEYGHKYHEDNPSVLEKAAFIIGDREGRKEVSSRISSYAATHPTELVAEAYAMSKHPSYESLPSETRQLVSKILSPTSSAKHLYRAKVLPKPPEVAAGFCKPGQRSDLTGCVPAGEDPDKTRPPPKNESDQRFAQWLDQLEVNPSPQEEGRTQPARHAPPQRHGSSANYGYQAVVNTGSILPMTPRRKKLLEGKPLQRRKLEGGQGNTYRISIEGDGDVAFKAASMETPGMRFNVPWGKSYLREAAAAEIAEVLGMDDLVPMTVVREMDGELGSAQQWVHKSEAACEVPRDTAYDGPDDRARAAAFDLLTGNSDRHFGNWLVRPDGKLVLIDNGLSFPTEHSTTVGAIRLLLRELENDAPLPPEVKKWGKHWDAMEKVLRYRGIEDEAIVLAKQRLDVLTDPEVKTFRQAWLKADTGIYQA